MKVTSVEIHTENSSKVLTLSYRDPGRHNSYNVKTIIGLDADEIISRYYRGLSETSFYNISLQKRELVVRAELNPKFEENETYSELRDEVYRMVASSRTGKVHVKFKENETVVACISGFITKLESAHFSKTPEVQLTIECSDPMLKAPEPVVVDISDLDTESATIVDNLSTAPHGLRFAVEFLSNHSEFSIGGDDWEMRLLPIGGFLAGDVLHISSETNDRQIYVVRGGITIHKADAITTGSVWPTIFPGENEFVIGDPETVAWSELSYYPTYWGV